MKGQVRYYLLSVHCEDTLVNNFPIINTGRYSLYSALYHTTPYYIVVSLFVFASNYVGQ